MHWLSSFWREFYRRRWCRHRGRLDMAFVEGLQRSYGYPEKWEHEATVRAAALSTASSSRSTSSRPVGICTLMQPPRSPWPSVRVAGMARSATAGHRSAPGSCTGEVLCPEEYITLEGGQTPRTDSSTPFEESGESSGVVYAWQRSRPSSAASRSAERPATKSPKPGGTTELCGDLCED